MSCLLLCRLETRVRASSSEREEQVTQQIVQVSPLFKFDAFPNARARILSAQTAAFTPYALVVCFASNTDLLHLLIRSHFHRFQMLINCSVVLS